MYYNINNFIILMTRYLLPTYPSILKDWSMQLCIFKFQPSRQNAEFWWTNNFHKFPFISSVILYTQDDDQKIIFHEENVGRFF